MTDVNTPNYFVDNTNERITDEHYYIKDLSRSTEVAYYMTLTYMIIKTIKCHENHENHETK